MLENIRFCTTCTVLRDLEEMHWYYSVIAVMLNEESTLFVVFFSVVYMCGGSRKRRAEPEKTEERMDHSS